MLWSGLFSVIKIREFSEMIILGNKWAILLKILLFVMNINLFIL